MHAGRMRVALVSTWLLAGCFSSNRGALQLEVDPADDGCVRTDACTGEAVTNPSPMDGVGGSSGVAGSPGNVGTAGSGAGAGVAGETPTAGTPFAGMAMAGMDEAPVDPGLIGLLPMEGSDPIGGCEAPGAYDPLSAVPGETCYDLRVHGVSDPADTTPFPVDSGESYHQFYSDVPWPAGALGTRVGTDFDNLAVIHGWRVYATTASVAAGTVERNGTGLVFGEQAALLAAYHMGGCNLTFPDDVGLSLPSTGKLMLQVHVYNATGQTQTDSTRVWVCTVPSGTRPNVAGLTFLGTEDLNGIVGMAAGMNEFSSRCLNDSDGPITLVVLRPHMHFIGIHMRSEILRAAGGSEVVLDQPFQYDYQIHYPLDPRPVLQPADDLETTCTFFNDRGSNVAYGVSSFQEMCYQLAYSYPAGALDNGVPSIIGAINTCW